MTIFLRFGLQRAPESEFVDFELCEEDVKYSIEKCKERDATYAAPLKVKVRLINKEKDEITEHESLWVICRL